MQIIDRYIFKQVVKGYFLLLISFLFLYVIIDVFTQLQDILKDKTDPVLMARYYLYFLPQIFIRVSPLSFLISSLYSIGVLNRNNELISMRAQGFSVFGISRVFIISSLLVSTASLFVEDKVVPASFVNLEKIHGYKSKAPEEPQQASSFAFYSREGYVVFAKDFDVGKGVLSNVNIFIQDDEGAIIQEVIAEKLVYKRKRWFVQNGLEYTLTESRRVSGDPSFIGEKGLDLHQEPKDLFKESSLNWEDLSLKDIKEQIQKFSLWKAQKIITFLEVEFHKKIALNLSTFFLILGSLPFALRIKKRRVGLSSLGLAILMSFLYYLLFSLSSALGKVDFFFPWVSCWLPNIFFGISGIVGLLSMS